MVLPENKKPNTEKTTLLPLCCTLFLTLHSNVSTIRRFTKCLSFPVFPMLSCRYLLWQRLLWRRLLWLLLFKWKESYVFGVFPQGWKIWGMNVPVYKTRICHLDWWMQYVGCRHTAGPCWCGGRCRRAELLVWLLLFKWKESWVVGVFPHGWKIWGMNVPVYKTRICHLDWWMQYIGCCHAAGPCWCGGRCRHAELLVWLLLFKWKVGLLVFFPHGWKIWGMNVPVYKTRIWQAPGLVAVLCLTLRWSLLLLLVGILAVLQSHDEPQLQPVKNGGSIQLTNNQQVWIVIISVQKRE